MTEDAEVVSIGNNDDCKDEMVEISPLMSKNPNGATGYLTPKARLAFSQLKKAFIKTTNLQHFDLEYHIRIEISVSGYTIVGVLNQLALDNSGQWHLIVFYSQKMILAKTRYKTHNGELLVLVEAFKTWRHYLKSCKHKILILIDHNNLCRFIDIKSLNSCQVWWM